MGTLEPLQSAPSSSSRSSLTLPQLYLSILTSLHPLLSSPTLSAPASQAALTQCLADLELVERLIGALGVFSPNEGMEDVPDGAMGLMGTRWVRAECEARVQVRGMRRRLEVVERTRSAYTSFLDLLSSYALPPPPSSLGTAPPASALSSTNPATRRDAKIAQYRLEKGLKGAVLQAFPDAADDGSDFEGTITRCLAAVVRASGEDGEGAGDVTAPSGTSESSTARRSGAIALLQLMRVHASSALGMVEQEAQLLEEGLRSARVEDEEDEERGERRAQQENGQEVDTTWRLDKPLVRPEEQRARDLLDERGRPTQPFTILPSDGLQRLSERARLQADVFRSSHRLPTMTIDEYLEEEERRGNIITGGGPAQDAQLTTSELLALAAEQDGTRDARAKEEEKRQKEEKWAQYTDEHRKGEGNTMNRG